VACTCCYGKTIALSERGERCLLLLWNELFCVRCLIPADEQVERARINWRLKTLLTDFRTFYETTLGCHRCKKVPHIHTRRLSTQSSVWSRAVEPRYVGLIVSACGVYGCEEGRLRSVMVRKAEMNCSQLNGHKRRTRQFAPVAVEARGFSLCRTAASTSLFNACSAQTRRSSSCQDGHLHASRTCWVEPIRAYSHRQSQ